MALQNFSWVISGKLAGCALPGGMYPASGDAIDADLAQLHDRGIRCLVSLQKMPDTFRDQCAGAGLKWLHFPVDDFDVPADKAAFAQLVDTVIARMDEAQPVCAHCQAGVGRTGMLLACIVGKYFDIDAAAAIAAVRKKRVALDTASQMEFVREFCAKRFQ